MVVTRGKVVVCRGKGFAVPIRWIRNELIRLSSQTAIGINENQLGDFNFACTMDMCSSHPWTTIKEPNGQRVWSLSVLPW